MIGIRDYKKAASLEEAYQLNQKRGNRLLGGMLWLKLSRNSVQTVIDISGLGLDKIEETGEGLRLGAMVTLRQLELDEKLVTYGGGAFREAVGRIVGVQFRNLATLGGSIYGRFGFSDVLTLFLALDATVCLYKRGRVPLRDYAALPYDRDIITHLLLPKAAPLAVAYRSARLTETDFPLLTCGCAVRSDALNIAVGARPGRALLLSGLEKYAGRKLKDEEIEEIAAHAAATVPTGSNTRGSAAYRTHLVQVLCARALRACFRKEDGCGADADS